MSTELIVFYVVIMAIAAAVGFWLQGSENKRVKDNK
jgi:hypothetical protein